MWCLMISSSVQEIDGSYFESFTALAWKQENQRQSVLKTAEMSISEAPSSEGDLGITPIDFSMSQNEKDKLYVEMLYTIANAVIVANFCNFLRSILYVLRLVRPRLEDNSLITRKICICTVKERSGYPRIVIIACFIWQAKKNHRLLFWAWLYWKQKVWKRKTPMVSAE